MAQRRSKFEPLNFPIEPVLEYLGADVSSARGPRSGWQIIGCVFPDHPDNSPSATFHRGANRFHCWAGCTDRPEDAVGLLMTIERLDFQAALEEAERITGVSRKPVQRSGRAGAALFDQSWYLD